MVEKYNNTYHRSIKLTPSDARNPANYQHAHNALYAKVNARKATSPKFHVGNKIRITRKKGTFENWLFLNLFIRTNVPIFPQLFYNFH